MRTRTQRIFLLTATALLTACGKGGAPQQQQMPPAEVGVQVAKAGPAVIVSNVPQFTIYTDDAARRFVQLVDEFYDRRVKLILSAAAPITELYDGERLRAEFGRTESRLIEMQSEEYLASEHLP